MLSLNLTDGHSTIIMTIRSAASPLNNMVIDRWGGCTSLELKMEEIVMPIVRYDPFRDLRTLQEEVNRLFSTNLTRDFGEEGIGRGAWNPRC